MARRPALARSLPIALVALACAACGGLGPEGPRLEVERRWEVWKATRPSTYRFELERLCFCGAEARGPVRVVVDGTTVTSRVYVDSGDPVPADLAPLFPSIDGLFDVLREAIDAGATTVQATYDPGSGAPISIWIDRSLSIADEELGFEVGPVESLPAP